MMRIEREKLTALKRHWLTVAFLGGFVVDNLTLNRVDQVFDNVVLLWYVFLAAASMLALYAATAERVPERMRPYAIKYAPLALQFAFGGLLSGMLIFYGRSGSWLASWPFLVLILAVIIGNETIRQRAQRLVFNLLVFFIGLFSYTVLIVPVVLGKMGAFVFVLSGLLAVVVFFGFVRMLYGLIPNFMTVNLKNVIFSLGMTFALLNIFYFLNIIPPIPLSLKHVGVYHNVERLGDEGYRLTYEDGAWYQPFKDSDTTFHYEPGDTIFCYAAVFAPTRLATDIYHRWEFKDPNEGWVSRDRLSYSIEGGRNGGYRGFTQKSTIEEGAWRCTVETARGQVLGREVFKVVNGAPERSLTTREE